MKKVTAILYQFLALIFIAELSHATTKFHHVTVLVLTPRGPPKFACVADCYFIVNVLDLVDLPFASPIAIYS